MLIMYIKEDKCMCICVHIYINKFYENIVLTAH